MTRARMVYDERIKPTKLRTYIVSISKTDLKARRCSICPYPI
jgi:hypothetical protein